MLALKNRSNNSCTARHYIIILNESIPVPMRIFILAVALVTLVCGCTRNQPQRFQLFQGSYETLTANIDDAPRGTSTQEKALFRIDTATGKVWRYYNRTAVSIKKTTLMEVWEEIPEKSAQNF
jgi:hypothetical protein